MVFDWFRRRTTAPGETVPDEAAAASPLPDASDRAEEPGLEAVIPEQDHPAPGASRSEVAPQLPMEPPTAAASTSVAPESSPAAGAIDQEALEWARQAYARLKAQQQVAAAAAPATAVPAASPFPETPSPATTPPSASLPAQALSAPVEAPPDAEPVAALKPESQSLEPMAAAETSVATPPPAASAEVQVQAPGAPVWSAVIAPTEPAQQALAAEAPAEPIVSAAAPAAVTAPETVQAPAAPLAVPPASPAPAAPGLSLLEQAAAQRQQRLRELTAPELPGGSDLTPSPAGSTGPEITVAVPAGASTVEEPQLGAFDETFTWSAEVLAAQGRTVDQVSLEEIDWLGRLRRGLEKTRRGFVTQLLDTLGDDPLTPEVVDDLETTLLRADVGVQATDQVLAALRQRLNEEVVDPTEGLRFLKEQLRGLLEAPITASGRPLLVPEKGRLNVWLLVGVNGVGKTTTLGKLANLAVRSGYTCLIAAADTFRAAAVQQVSVWGERSGVPVISNPSANADPAAVVYDAIGAAQAKGSELVLVDTAGRLQTKHNLMEELAKVRRIVDKLAPEAAVESLLVLDASQGQNGLKQAMAFAQAAGLTGVVLTKLDGSARGGVALAVASEAQLPIRFIGAGESIRDLRPFNSFEFVEALLAS